MFLTRTAVIFVCLALALGEVVDFKRCDGVDESCTVNEVRVAPCPEALSHRACNIRRRKLHQMSFDFTPTFDAETLEASLGWLKSDTQELPMISLDRNACNFVACPVRAGEQSTYNVTLPADNKFPISSYTIKWQLKAPSGQKCCFTIDIKVVR